MAPLSVLTAMLGPGKGGIEQAFVDQCEALIACGHAVAALLDRRSPLAPKLARIGVPVSSLAHLGEWDWRARRMCRHQVARIAPDIVLTHGRRAAILLGGALGVDGRPPHVTVVGKTEPSYAVGMDHVVVVSEALRRRLIALGQPAGRVSLLPNLVRVPADVLPRAIVREPPVIGALGRFVAVKGFRVLLDALGHLRALSQPFRARIGGGGEQASLLQRRARDLGIADVVEFPGWIEDKRTFFESIDIFCVPSLEEAFGIVVLEGMAHGTAVVATDADGPREIVRDGEDALLVPRGDADALARALQRLLSEPELRRRLAEAGLRKVRAHYDLPVVGARLSALLEGIVARARGERQTC